MEEEKTGVSKSTQGRGATTEKGDQKDMLPMSKKSVEVSFALELAFPKLDGLLDSHKFPSLKDSKDVIVALERVASPG